MVLGKTWVKHSLKILYSKINSYLDTLLKQLLINYSLNRIVLFFSPLAYNEEEIVW
jgi:hypothetical protein